MGRVKGLDGLRGIAILLVVSAHLFGGTAPRFRPLAEWTRTWMIGGGFVGVQLFFVLSGYLITGILLRELQARGTLNLLRFWARRIRRLYPALLVVAAVYTAYAFLVHTTLGTPLGRHVIVFGAPTITEARSEVLNTLTYTTNFRGFGQSVWLDHMWSLAVEEQFYLVWPILLLTGWLVARRWGVIAIAVAGIIVTAAARQLAGMSPDRVYELLRWDALLIGCVLAVIVPRPVQFRGQSFVGGAGFAVLVAYSVRTFDYAPQSYTIVAVAAGAALLASLRWGWLGHPVLRYFGRISYSLYLWHMLFLRLAWPGPLSLVVSIGVADLSYRYVERRFWTPHTEPASAPPPAGTATPGIGATSVPS